VLLDGNFSNEDLLATLVYYALTPPAEPDEIEQEIMQNMSPHTIGMLYRMVHLGSQTEEEIENNIAGKVMRRIKQPIFAKERTKGWFRYDPRSVLFAGIAVTMFGLLALTGTTAFDRYYFFRELLFGISASIFALGVLTTAFSYTFFQDADETVPLQAKAHGYRMYLQTVEWYRIEKDLNSFRQAMPYFILFGLKTEHFDTLIEYAQQELQLGASTANA